MLPWWLEKVLGIDVRPPGADAEPRPVLKTGRRSLEAHPEGVASAVLARLVERPYAELASSQRRAWLVATYTLGVRNSGHAGYFGTHGVGRAAETRAALGELGLRAARGVLDEAIQRHVSVPGETGALPPGAHPVWRPARYDDLDGAAQALADEVEAAVRRDVRDHVRDFVAVEG